MSKQHIADQANAFVSEWYGGFAKPSVGAASRPPILSADSDDGAVREWLRWNSTSFFRGEPWDNLAAIFEETD